MAQPTPPSPPRNAPHNGLPGRGWALLVLILTFLPCTAPAQDGLQHYQTRYVEIVYSRDQDLIAFTGDIGRGFGSLMQNPRRNPLLTRSRVDGLVDIVLKLLDMRTVSPRFTIRVYQYQADLEQAYRQTGMTGPVPAAFYTHHSKTIFVSLEKLSAGILAHEIAHAVISTYFSPPPPVRIQEVLAQYVDDHLDDE